MMLDETAIEQLPIEVMIRDCCALNGVALEKKTVAR